MPDSYKTFFVINPKSANNTTEKKFLSLFPEIKGFFADFDFKKTLYPMHATEITRYAIKDGYEMIVSVGGDGTLNEVLNGFFENGRRIGENVVLGVLPSGTGGDFRKTLLMGYDMKKSLIKLKGKGFKKIDCGNIKFTENGEKKERYFINIGSFGISGVVDHYVNKTTKFFGGKVSFFIGSLRGMLAYKNEEVRIILDEIEIYNGKMCVCAVANGKYFGGGMMIAPRAIIDDGLFDVIILGDLSKKEFLSLSTKIYKGKHVGHPKIFTFQGNFLRAESDSPLLLDIDGENIGKTPAEFSLLPSSIALKS